MGKCYSWVWIKYAIRVRRNRNYIWYCYTANLNLHSLKVAKVDLFPLLFRLSSRFHCMGYSSRRLWIIKKEKSNWTVIAIASKLRTHGWIERLFYLFFSIDEIIIRCYHIYRRVFYSSMGWSLHPFIFARQTYHPFRR